MNVNWWTKCWWMNVVKIIRKLRDEKSFDWMNVISSSMKALLRKWIRMEELSTLNEMNGWWVNKWKWMGWFQVVDEMKPNKWNDLNAWMWFIVKTLHQWVWNPLNETSWKDSWMIWHLCWMLLMLRKWMSLNHMLLFDIGRWQTIMLKTLLAKGILKCEALRIGCGTGPEVLPDFWKFLEP